MSALRIVKMGNPILRKRALEVINFNTIKPIIRNMKDTLLDIGASGLAAPQVMIKKRIVVYRLNKNRIPKNSNLEFIPWTTMINPKIKPLTSEKKLYWERCLSLPGLHGKVPRYKNILVTYYDIDQKKITHKASSTWAALIQHECDHLDGVLYPMRMNDLSKFGYNDEPGDIKEDAKYNRNSIDPLFLELVKNWPNVSQ